VNNLDKLLTGIYRIDQIPTINSMRTTRCVPQFAGGPLGSWGPRLKPT